MGLDVRVGLRRVGVADGVISTTSCGVPVEEAPKTAGETITGVPGVIVSFIHDGGVMIAGRIGWI